MVKVFSISTKARKMSVPAFEQYITDELVASVMETIEHSLVSGTGETGQGAGIETIEFSEANNNLVELSATPAYTDFTKALALLKRGYSNGAKFAMNNATLYNVVYSIVDMNKRPIFIADPKAESIGMILGTPVIIDDNIADNEIYLGNFNYLGYNLPEGITVEVSTESSFKSNLIDFKATALADTKVILSEAFVKLAVAEG
ncbi:phage major capsid protein [Aerococcaceae bacterium WGS1372]